MLKTILINSSNFLNDRLAAYCLTESFHCSDISEGIQQVGKRQADLIVLDLDKPGLSGDDLLEAFSSKDIEMIVLSKDKEYALKAFEVSALDYVQKPFKSDRLELALKRAKAQVDLKNTSKVKAEKLKISTQEGTRYIELNDVIALEASRAYCKIYVKDGSSILVSKSLGKYEDILKTRNNFFKVHRSFLVNLDYVEAYLPGESKIILQNGICVKVSRPKKKEFESKF